MNLVVALFLRVLYPLVGFPQGETGCLPPDVLPSPPPCGWSTGFIATPLTLDLIPNQRLLPAFPKDTFAWSIFPICPTVARHSRRIILTSPEGSFICAYAPSFATSWAPDPALLTS